MRGTKRSRDLDPGLDESRVTKKLTAQNPEPSEEGELLEDFVSISTQLQPTPRPTTTFFPSPDANSSTSSSLSSDRHKPTLHFDAIALPAASITKGSYVRKSLNPSGILATAASQEPEKHTYTRTTNNALESAVLAKALVPKSSYERKVGGVLPLALLQSRPKNIKPPGSLPLSTSDKHSRVLTKLNTLFSDMPVNPSMLNFVKEEEQSVERIFRPIRQNIRLPANVSGKPTEATLSGFWPSPTLARGKETYPLPIPEMYLGHKDEEVFIFVDNSNILYAFLDWATTSQSDVRFRTIAYKTKGKEHRSVRTVTVDDRKIIFDYSLFFAILERGRRVSRRVLVGSSPLWQGLDKALEWSYEISILQRVAREKESTSGNGASSISGSTRSSTPCSDNTNKPWSNPDSILSEEGEETSKIGPSKAMREQGVDEILHMKILETLLDNSPSYGRAETQAPLNMRPVLVLATGDANASEYNPSGFKGCVQRALLRGWDVELYAFQRGLGAGWSDLATELNPNPNPGGSSPFGSLKVIDLQDFGSELVSATGSKISSEH